MNNNYNGRKLSNKSSFTQYDLNFLPAIMSALLMYYIAMCKHFFG